MFQCDIVNDDLTNQMPEEVVDVATMIFVLSAIHPEKMAVVLRKIYRVIQQLITCKKFFIVEFERL